MKATSFFSLKRRTATRSRRMTREFEKQIEIARKGMDAYKNTLRELAK